MNNGINCCYLRKTDKIPCSENREHLSNENYILNDSSCDDLEKYYKQITTNITDTGY